MSDKPSGDLDRAFDEAMRAHELVVPEDLRAGAIAAFAELRAQARLLRKPRDPYSEPAAVFDLSKFLRSGEPRQP